MSLPPDRSVGIAPDARPPEGLSFADLLAKLAGDLTDLFRKEVQLARAELGDKASQMATGLVSIAIGAILALVALIVLAGALVSAVAQIGDPDIGAGWAALIVGGILLAIGALLAWKGSRDMKPSSLSPERMTRQIEKDARLAKEQVT